jgi:hypothetical protein
MHGVGKAIAQIIDAVTCAGRVLCMYCKKDMGPAPTDMDSHSVCTSCANDPSKWDK